MAQLSDVTVIDIGSRSIGAYRAEILSEENFTVLSSCEIDYSGYMDGAWLDEEEIVPAFARLLERIERSTGPVKEVFIGIPAQFCTVKTVPAGVTFASAKRPSATDIKNLIDHYDPFTSDGDCLLHAEALYYLTDEGKYTLTPQAEKTSSLKAELSYIACEASLIAFFKKACARCGVKDVRFIQSEYAAAMHLFSRSEREEGVFLADIGFLATTVQYIAGDGVVDMKTFSLGGAFIPAGLTDGLSIPYGAACVLSSRLNLASGESGNYTFDYDGREYVYPIERVNDMVRECLKYVASNIKKAIAAVSPETDPTVPVYLTGGGLYGIRGATEQLSKYAEREIRYIHPDVANYTKPYYSTAVGLILTAAQKREKGLFGFIKRLFSK